MQVTLKEIFSFINEHILFFVIPIDVIIVVLLAIVIVRYRKGLKGGKKNERKGKNRTSRATKKSR